MLLFRAHKSKDAAGTARSLDDFQRRRDQDRTFRRKLIEIGEACKAEFAPAMHDGVAWEWRLETEGLAGVGAHSFRAPADDVTLLGQKRDQFGIGAWHMGAVFFDIQERGGIRALRPIRAHQHPRAGFYSAVPGF